MIRQSLFISAWLVLSAGLAMGFETLLDPGSQADVARIQGNGGAEITAVKTTGRPAVRVRTGHTNDWPGVEVPAPAGVWNLSACTHVAVELANIGDNDVKVFCRVDNTGADGVANCLTGELALKPGASGTLKVPLRRNRAGFVTIDLFGMRGYPWDLTGPWAGKGETAIDPAKVVRILVFVSKPKADHAFQIAAIRGEGQFAPLPLLAQPDKFFPFIDKYGQYIHADWPGKTHTDDDFSAHRQAEARDLAGHPAPADWDRYGGWKDGPKCKATGFFYTAKREGKWWLVDPDGHLFFSQGIDCVTPCDGSTPIDERATWFRDLPAADGPFQCCYSQAGQAVHGHYEGKQPICFDFGQANLIRKYGQGWSAACTEMTHQRLRSWGLNTIGNWSSADIYRKGKTPYVVAVHFGGTMLAGSQGYWGKFRDVFDPDFAALVRKTMGQQAETTAGDPWCIGYFVDNEVAWGDDDVSLAIAALASPAGQQAKTALINDLRAKYADIEKLNQAWGTQHASWDALQTSTTPPDAAKAHADLAAFHVRTCETYFQTVRGAVKDVAPNHLYLGCRFAWANPPAIAAAAKYCDVVSFNIYQHSVAEFKLPVPADVPLLIGEFHFGALDRGMFHAGLVPVDDQAGRAAAYAEFVDDVLKHPLFVGCHWFKYRDEPTTGRALDEENYQIGFLDVGDTAYPETIQAAREVAEKMYRIRSATPAPKVRRTAD